MHGTVRPAIILLPILLLVHSARAQEDVTNALDVDEAAVLFLEDGSLQSGVFDQPHRRTSHQQFPGAAGTDIPPPAPSLGTPPPPAPGDLESSSPMPTGGAEPLPEIESFESTGGEFEVGFDQQIRTIPLADYESALEALNTPFDGIPQDIPRVGIDYVAFASFAIESPKPRTQLRFRIESLTGINQPDRSEYLWKSIGEGGPDLPEERLDMQSFSIYSETAFDGGGGFLQIPIRMLNPHSNPNTASLGNLVIGTKSILAEGEGFFWIPTRRANDHFYVGMYFATEISLNPLFTTRGLTHGHTTLTPGLLGSYELSRETVFQGEMKLHIPLGGTTGFAGQVLEYGVGVSHVLYSSIIDSPDCEHVALMGTLELEFMSFLGGQQTVGFIGDAIATELVDSVTAVSMHTGLRYALNNRVDVGASTGFNLSSNRYYSTLGRIELRWHW